MVESRRSSSEDLHVDTAALRAAARRSRARARRARRSAEALRADGRDVDQPVVLRFDPSRRRHPVIPPAPGEVRGVVIPLRRAA